MFNKILSVSLIAVVLGAGCNVVGGDSAGDGSESTYDAARSGSRLKRRIRTTSDGSQQFVGWFDTDRGESCSFRKVEWNVERCIPDENVIEAIEYRDSTVYYTDQSCTVPVVRLGPPSTSDCWQGIVSKYVILDDRLSCKETSFEIYQAGNRLAADDSDETMQVYGRDDGDCVDAGTANANEYASLSAVDLNEFVEGGERIE